MTARSTMASPKSAEAFRTISEASAELDVPQHVLRHWEEVFGQIRPMRRAGGRRYYRPVDLDLLRGVRVLLYNERYTTKGVQKIFRENGVKYVTELGRLSAAGQPIELRPLLDEDADDRERPDTARQASADAVSAEAERQIADVIARLERAQAAVAEATEVIGRLARRG